MSLTKVTFSMIKEEALTYQIPSDYATLQAAVDALAPLGPTDRVNLNIESGHQPASGISVTNGNYSGFRVTSTDAEVTLSASFGTSGIFINAVNAQAPILACLIDANSQLGTGYRVENNSTGYIESGCGIKNVWGSGLLAFKACTVYAEGTIWTGCAINGATGAGITTWASITYAAGADTSDSGYYGAQAAHGGTLNFQLGKADRAVRYGIRATDGAYIAADACEANDCGEAGNPQGTGLGIYAFNGCRISARDAKADGCLSHGVLASGASIIHVRGGSFTNCGQYGMQAVNGSSIDAVETDVSGAGIFGYYAVNASLLSCSNSTADNCGTGANDGAVYADSASNINAVGLQATNCSGIAIRSETGSVVEVSGSTITGAGNRAAYAAASSTINANNSTATGATNEGAFAAAASTINAQLSNFQRGGSPSSDDIKVDNGSFINATLATGGLSQTANTVTAKGIIFQ
jgi:hypothetical protein